MSRLLRAKTRSTARLSHTKAAPGSAATLRGRSRTGNSPAPHTIMSESPALDLSAAKGPILPAANVAATPVEPEGAYVRVPPPPRAVTRRLARSGRSTRSRLASRPIRLARCRTRHAGFAQLQSSLQLQLLRLHRSILDRWSQLQRQAPSQIQRDHIGLVPRSRISHQSRRALHEKLHVRRRICRPRSNLQLGSQTYINSVDDPVNGYSSVVYPHNFAPMLLIGFGNIIPRAYRHFSVPFEIGAAYTGAPLISVPSMAPHAPRTVLQLRQKLKHRQSQAGDR